MADTNQELIQLMEELQLSRDEVAKQLNVPVTVVDRWTASDGNEAQEMMPESDLRLLKYALMSENKRSHLF